VSGSDRAMTCRILLMPRFPVAALFAGAALSTFVGLAYAQPQDAAPTGVLEEIIVTATRVATNLQQTPLSVAAFSGERLELAGIDAGRDLGIMVPNAVFAPIPAGERFSHMVIRGLPGVATYIDGVSFGGLAFQQRNFVELERVEVLRGPQGTHFGRNTNGGAIQLITRPPADQFGTRLDVEFGELDRRVLKVAADVPLLDRLKTKWIAGDSEVDGFVDSQTVPYSFGDERDTLLRADVLWEPTDDFSLRAYATQQEDEGSDARILRIPNTSNPVYVAYNVLAGNPDYIAQARAIDPSFPDPPFALAGDRYTPETHESGYPGGSLGRWQTRSNMPGPTSVIEQRYLTLLLDWHVTDRWTFESLSSYGETRDTRQLTDWDTSEFTHALVMVRNRDRQSTQEVHLIGNHFDGRLRSLMGFYHNKLNVWARPSSWWFWEFAVPNTGPNPGLPGPPGLDGRPALNLDALNYVRAWGATVGDPTVANFFPPTFLTADRLFNAEDIDRAVFGEFVIGLRDRLDLTVGFRFTEDKQWGVREYLPADAFRPAEPGVVPAGDPFAPAALIDESPNVDLGTISTPRVSLSYQATDDIYVYASYAEGFTSGEVITNPFLPDPIVLGPEVVKTREIGLRSDWLGQRLRLNATYFDSRWDGLRVPKTVPDPDNPGLFLPVAIPSDDGVAEASGAEIELEYVAGVRWDLSFALGLLDTEYVEIGIPAEDGTGLQPGIPFPFAPEMSYSLGIAYRLPLGTGGEILFRGDYGWMDDYERGLSAEFQRKNADGSNRPEPAYGLLNARIVYTPARANWQLSLFGTNLTNEWYVNGGFDLGYAWGYGPSTIGRPREIGAGVRFTFD
jgi:iron complex outermembrane receptor protein